MGVATTRTPAEHLHEVVWPVGTTNDQATDPATVRVGDFERPAWAQSIHFLLDIADQTNARTIQLEFGAHDPILNQDIALDGSFPAAPVSAENAAAFLLGNIDTGITGGLDYDYNVEIVIPARWYVEATFAGLGIITYSLIAVYGSGSRGG